MSMDKQTVTKVARLARLKMSDAELEKMGPQLSGILSWIEQLQEVNTDNVEPLANVADIELFLREDKVNDGDCQDKVLANAPETTQGYFVTNKIVE